MLRLIFALCLLVIFNTTQAAMEIYPFNSATQEQQFHKLTQKLRCPKCQNNSIADSNSMIARDMRQKVFTLLKQGKNEQQITEYMVARYGHFVSYQPPLTMMTLWLWLLPIAFILCGGFKVWRDTRSQTPKPSLTPEQQQRLAKLVQKSGERS